MTDSIGAWLFFVAAFAFQFLILSSLFFIISRNYILAGSSFSAKENLRKKIENFEFKSMELVIRYIAGVSIFSGLIFLLSEHVRWNLTFFFRERLIYFFDITGLFLLHLFQLSAFLKF